MPVANLYVIGLIDLLAVANLLIKMMRKGVKNERLEKCGLGENVHLNKHAWHLNVDPFLYI